MSKREKISQNSIPEGFTMGLALYDALPVLFFGISAVLIGVSLDSWLFLLGGAVSFWAGAAKVIWKIIVVKKRQNIWWLFMQMRICMPIGFLIMIAAAMFCGNRENAVELGRFDHQFPVSIFLIIGFAGFVLMGVVGATLDSGEARNNWIEQTINTLAQLSILLGAVFLFISVPYLKADDVALDALYSDDVVLVETYEGQVVFTPMDGATGDGLIFYPGGKVEFTSYAPLMRELAEKGISCVLVEMPLNYAFLGSGKAGKAMESVPNVDSWYLAGHSLGGAFGSIYASSHKDSLSGMILLGAYSTKDLSDMPVLSIFGSEDGVMQRDKYEEYRANLPDDCTELIIVGGNHAMFGSYGEQDCDGGGLIEAEDQWRVTAETIAEFILLN